MLLIVILDEVCTGGCTDSLYRTSHSKMCTKGVLKTIGIKHFNYRTAEAILVWLKVRSKVELLFYFEIFEQRFLNKVAAAAPL